MSGQSRKSDERSEHRGKWSGRQNRGGVRRKERGRRGIYTNEASFFSCKSFKDRFAEPNIVYQYVAQIDVLVMVDDPWIPTDFFSHDDVKPL